MFSPSFMLLLVFISGEFTLTASVARLSSVLMTSATSKSKATCRLSASEKTMQGVTHPTTQSTSKDRNVVDLWIVGCGKLGTLVAKQWLELYPSDVVIGETMTTTNHDAIAQVGAIPRLRSERLQSNIKHVKNVLIALPPYSKSPKTSEKYLAEVHAAVSLPFALFQASSSPSFNAVISDDSSITSSTSNSDPFPSRILLISSTSVYAAPLEAPSPRQLSHIVTEFTPVAMPGTKEYSSAFRSIEAEKMVLSGGQGSVLRLAGLYDTYRGPHMYWLSAIASMQRRGQQREESDRNNDKSYEGSLNLEAEGLINLVHYEDAATAAVKAMQKGNLGAVYLACDGNPVSRRNIIHSAAEANLVPGLLMPQDSKIFKSPRGSSREGEAESLLPLNKPLLPSYNKICDANWTSQVLEWTPVHPRFDVYMRSMS